MVEYLYNTIRATSGSVMSITAIVSDDDGNDITEGCVFKLFDNDKKLLIAVDGEYENNEWIFNVPTNFDRGKYWYAISYDDADLCFYQRLYLI